MSVYFVVVISASGGGGGASLGNLLGCCSIKDTLEQALAPGFFLPYSEVSFKIQF